MTMSKVFLPKTWPMAMACLIGLLLACSQGCARAVKESDANLCPKCGHPMTTGDTAAGHKCQSAPLSKAQLEQRKHEAHALSRGQDGEFNLRSGSSSSRPKEWTEYIKNDSAAIALGKALFWEMRVGSDDRTACATCHHHAGVDTRTRNTAFAYRAEDFVTNKDKKSLVNHEWTKADHVVNDKSKDSKDFGLIVGDSTLVIGSQGVRQRDFGGLDEKLNEKEGRVPDGSSNLRQVTKRNSPTVINAASLSRLFHDGRASETFNGYDVFGADSPYEDELGKYQVRNGQIERVSIEIPRAAAASQAVGPPVNAVEMSYKGRTFEHLAKKLLGSHPLVNQEVSPSDSVLGKYRKSKPDKSADNATEGATVTGLDTTYRELIQQAFHDSWWKAPDSHTEKKDLLPGHKSISDMMVANFSMYFGLAIMAYEQTLVSDDSPFDRAMRGDAQAMSLKARKGLDQFIIHGCADCHLMPEFSGATLSAIFGEGKEEVDDFEAKPVIPRPLPKPLNPDGTAFVEEMLFKQPQPRNRAYDNGFYNIGVTGLKYTLANGKPAAWDLGIGADFQVVTVLTDLPLDHIQANFDSMAETSKQGSKTLKSKGSRGVMSPEATASKKQAPNVKSKFTVSKARRLFPNQSPTKDGQSAVNGAFKTSSLRNISLTAPYMHNGAFLTLKEVIRFYRYGPRQFPNDPDAKFFHHPELEELRVSLSEDGKTKDEVNEADLELIAFLEALADERVKYHRAPFDHPSLILPNGNKEGIQKTGKDNDLDNEIMLPAVGSGLTEQQLKDFEKWSSLAK